CCSSRRRHTRCYRDWSSDVCSSDLFAMASIVDDAVTERGRAAAAPVRDYIIKSAAESGVRIQDRNVMVTTDERQLNINLRWTFQIGRASCRERVEIWVREVSVKGNK